MKNLTLLFALATLPPLGLSAQNLPAGSAGAVAQIVKGAPNYETGGQVLPVKKGITIPAGATVTTGAGELVILRLDNGGKIVVYQNSEVALQAESGDSAKLELHQPKGFTWSRLPKLKQDESFKVVTNSYTAGVRGTAFSVSDLEDGQTQVCVCEGAVQVEGDGKETTVKKGQLVQAKQGRALSPMADLKFLEHPTASNNTCIQCHHGGYSRDNLYR